MTINNGEYFNINQISKKEFENIFFDEHLPLLLNGLNMEMPAYRKWTFNFFKENMGHFLIPVGDDLKNPAAISRKMSIRNYITQLKEDKDCPYMVGWSYQRECPTLDNDFTLPELHPDDFIHGLPRHLNYRRSWIFFGKESIESDLHIDSFAASAWIIMIHGQKTLRTFSPVHRHLVKMGTSLFDEENIRKIKNQGVEIIEFKLIPGTIMYLPGGWVHQIRNDNDTIMVTGAFTAKSHVFQFYPSYQETISKDINDSEEHYLSYIKNEFMNIEKLPKESIQYIKEDILRTERRIEIIQDKMKLYKSLLNKN
ncbi:cupin-like domain-containing protein [Fluviispira vulneris]|uniref:cupin-like domain-containing protein n=1 Tax=Fluviispira vulneris TaxID=2763012 RepID=UPI0016459607|nr:cupin-like domain-containing protein [Fluviispira vulneris]